MPGRSTQQTQIPVRYKDYVLMTQIEELINFEQSKDHKE